MLSGGPDRSFPADLLTPQETRVMQQLSRGLSNKQIAQQLRLSEGTVRNYLSSAFGKLGVENRLEACVNWLRLPSVGENRPSPK